MANYKVLKTFTGLKEKKVFKKDKEVEFTVKRADEIAENLKEKGVFLKRIDSKKEEKAPENEVL